MVEKQISLAMCIVYCLMLLLPQSGCAAQQASRIELGQGDSICSINSLQAELVSVEVAKGLADDTLTMHLTVRNIGSHGCYANAVKGLVGDCAADLSKEKYIDNSLLLCAQSRGVRHPMKVLGEYVSGDVPWCPQVRYSRGVNKVKVIAVMPPCDSCRITGYFSFLNGDDGNSICGTPVNFNFTP